MFVHFGHFPANVSLLLNYRQGVGVVVGLPELECADQDGADEGERHAYDQHIQLHGKVRGHVAPRY